MDTRVNPPPQEGRTLAGLFSDLWRETSTLVHQEAELAKAEVSEKMSQVGTAIASIAAGGLVLFAGFLVLLFAAVNGIAPALPPEHADWLAPLIVGVAVMIAGFIAFAAGKRKLQAQNLKPHHTIDSLRGDSRLFKEHLS
jgi:hypothetical protein